MNPKILSKACLLLLLATGSLGAQPQSDTPLWIYDAGQVIQGSPAIAPDGTVYVGVGNSLHAVTNAGSVVANKWIFTSGLSTVGAPAIEYDGTVLISGGKLCAVNSDGSEKWSYPDARNGSPAVGWDNGVCIQGVSSLHAISADGTIKWSGSGGGGSGPESSAAIGPDGSLFIGSFVVQTGYYLGPDGMQKWAASVPVGDSAAIGADGTIYIAAANGDFSAPSTYAISPSGAVLWSNRYALGNRCFARSPAIANDGTIYVLTSLSFTFSYGFGLYAITPAGALKWQFVTNLFGGPCLEVGTPAIDATGTLYLRAHTSLFAVSPEGKVKWQFNTYEGGYDHTDTCPAIGLDGTIYAAFGSKLYAFAGTNKLADSPWPMYRQNARRTGKVEKPSLQNPQRRSGSNFQFQLYAQLGQTNLVESTTNLSVWSSLTSIVITTVPMEFVDLTASNAPSRFYRTLSQ